MHPRATALIDALDLVPHPEGGHVRRVHASTRQVPLHEEARAAMTVIRFLLTQGERSAWHRIDADEAWHWVEGERLEVSTFHAETGELQRIVLGDAARGFVPAYVVSAGIWQAARPSGAYALAACTVAPGFVWEGFELLDEGSATAQELSRLGAFHAADVFRPER